MIRRIGIRLWPCRNHHQDVGLHGPLEPGGKLCPSELVHVITEVVRGATADKVTGRATR